MKKLPKKIYAHWKNDTGQKDDEFLNTADDPQHLVDLNDTLVVGVYELVGTAEIKNQTTVKDK